MLDPRLDRLEASAWETYLKRTREAQENGWNYELFELAEWDQLQSRLSVLEQIRAHLVPEGAQAGYVAAR